jgi:hypothetical protein
VQNIPLCLGSSFIGDDLFVVPVATGDLGELLHNQSTKFAIYTILGDKK